MGKTHDKKERKYVCSVCTSIIWS